MIKNIRKESNDNSDRVKTEKKKPQKNTIKKSILILFMVMIIVLSATACLKLNNQEISNKDADSESDEDYSFLYGTDFEYDLHVSAINSKVSRYLYLNNIEYPYDIYTVEDYKKIEELSEEDLIGYYHKLGEEESEKVVQALGYDGWDDYLIKHNYLRDGKPSIPEWRRQLEIAYHKENSNKTQDDN